MNQTPLPSNSRSRPVQGRVQVLAGSLAAAGLAVSLLFTGCGPAEERPAEPLSSAPAPGQPAPAPQPAAGDARKVVIEGNDMMKFSVTEFSVRPGERVEVTLKNVGTMPKLSMGHDWVLLKAGVDVNSFIEAGFVHAAKDYIDPARKGDVIAATKLLGPGESDTAVFNAPKEPGKYVYVCTFPGHYAVGMKGVMTVQ